MFLNSVKTTIKLQPNRSYYMGASSSPKHIIYLKTDADLDIVYYMQYPYIKVSKTSNQGFIQLVQKGCETKLESLMSIKQRHAAVEAFAFFYPLMDEEIANLQKVLAGQDTPEVDPADYVYADYAYWTVFIKWMDETITGDAWRILEARGIRINGMTLTNELETSMTWASLKTLRLPAGFKVVRIEQRKYET